MNLKELHDIEKLEKDLWEAADQLRANSKLTSSDYFMPVLGIIFLRHAANRFDAATKLIEADQKSGKMPKRKVIPADYISRRSLYLPLRPSKKLLNLFDEMVVPIFNQIDVLKKQTDKVRQARDLLLPKLMSGEIAV